MTAKKYIQNIGAIIIVAAISLGLSYCSERPKYQFAASVITGSKQIPGVRLINSFKSGDLTSPVSWFWPATTRLVYARPDITAPTPRFYIMSFGYKDPPAVWLVEPDCQAKKEYIYFPAEPGENGEPARNVMGEPVTAPNGKRFLLHENSMPPNADNMRAFCVT
ncbi:MAG: hypothetical protein K9G48_16190 [Reyranella sp.]|nr:hypothetical protein [Reyranella sp.]